MNIAIDEEAVFLELDTPWNNLLGFEHVAQTKEEKHLVEKTLELLKQPEKLFLFEGGKCISGDVIVDSNLSLDDQETHQEEEHHEEENETHSSVLVSYSFNCADTADLSSINVNLFKLWTGFEDLDVQLIGPGGQSLVELSPQQTLLDITKVR